MTSSSTEQPATNPFSPREMTKGILYQAESYTADGEKIDLYMESLTKDSASQWQTYALRASSITNALKQKISPDSSKYLALASVSRGAMARGFFKGDYVVYATKHGTHPMLPETASEPDNIEKFEQDYNHILMSVNSECVPKEVFWGIMNKESYTNRGIFRNPLSIIEGKYRGLAMLLHGFSAAVAQEFLDKKFMEVSPIGSMQHILIHALPREAFRMKDEAYEKIKKAAENMSGGEVATNYIKIEALSDLYLRTSTQNASKANVQTPEETTQAFRQSVDQARDTTTNPDQSSNLKT